MICSDKATSSSQFQETLNILKLPPAHSATSRQFHLPPHFEDPVVTMHFILIKQISIQLTYPPKTFIFGNALITTHVAHMETLMDIHEVPVGQLYKHMIGQSEPILPFEINRDTEEGPSLTWKLLT